MPVDLNKLNENKQKIIDFIKSNGPSLPVHLARAISASPIFAAAFLSELYAEGRIKISNMRVGSSPLYYLSGQEFQLENFLSFLNHKEKEALSLLKNEKILEDESQEPAIRVALRSVKDFAIPLKVSVNDQTKTFWKYFIFQDNDVKELIKNKLNPQKTLHQTQYQPHEQFQPSQPQAQQIQQLQQNQQVQQLPLQTQQTTYENPAHQSLPATIPPQSIPQQPIQSIHKPSKEKKKKIIDNEFSNRIKKHLSSKDIELLSIIEEKKKDFSAKVMIDTIFGKQEYFLIAKDKKKITDTDITMAHQKSQQEKAPTLLIAPGELDKKALEYLSHWKNLIKFEKLK